MFKKYRITSKIRFTLFILIFILSIAIITGAIRGDFNASGQAVAKYDTVIVKPGDTLWSIASAHSDGSSDIRKYIYEIAEANDLDGQYLIEGQELKIPV